MSSIPLKISNKTYSFNQFTYGYKFERTFTNFDNLIIERITVYDIPFTYKGTVTVRNSSLTTSFSWPINQHRNSTDFFFDNYQQKITDIAYIEIILEHDNAYNHDQNYIQNEITFSFDFN